MKTGSPLRSGALLAALLLCAPAALAGENGTAVKADELKAEPFRDAKKVGSLAAGDKVEILKKEGGWFQVKSAKGGGWVKMLSIRRGEMRRASAGSEAAGLAGLASGRAGTGRVVATTGIRGLDEEQLKAAQFNAAELKLADTFVSRRPEAQSFAAKGKLVARKVDYLPDPSKGERP